MRGLECFSLWVLVIVCVCAFCDAEPGPIASASVVTLDPYGEWAIQSGSFAASKLNVKWLYNTKAEGWFPQSGSGGRYEFYNVWFVARKYTTFNEYYRCQASVHWPPADDSESWTVHLHPYPSFPSECVRI